MADGSNLPIDAAGLANITNDIKALANINMNAAVEAISKIEEKLKDAIRVLEGLPKGSQHLKEQTDIVKELRKQYDAATDALGGFGKAMASAKTETKETQKHFEALNGIFDTLGAKGAPVTSALKEMGQALLGSSALVLALGNNTVRSLISPLSSASDFIGTLPERFQNWNKVMQQSVDITNLVNTSFLSYGRTLEEASRPSELLADDLARIQQQFGADRKEIHEFISVTKGVPGALDLIGKSADTSKGPISEIALQMKVARGAGISMQEMGEMTKVAFARFGQAPREAASNIAIFNAAVDGTNIPITKAMSQIQTASEPLAIFGRHITEATNLWKTFSSTLGTQIPIDEIGNLVSSVSRGVATMGLNTQAFVAQMTGMAQGATALGGALQMELEMRGQGGMEKNLERVQQAISRLGGGKIITLQEAAQTPALEMQFQLQRQLVGQMLGVQGGQQQSRVLEVLQNVEKGGISRVTAGQQLEKLMTSGQKAQDASLTLLGQIARNTSRMTDFSKTMQAVEAQPKATLALAAQAGGARGAGEVINETHLRTVGMYFAKAGHQFVDGLKPAMTELFSTLGKQFKSIIKGDLDYQREYNYLKEHSIQANLPVIDIMKPSTPQLTGAPLPWGARTGQEPAAPMMFNRRIFETPTENRRITEAATTERSVPDTITVKVVCEQCGHKLGEKIEKTAHQLNQYGRGYQYPE